MELRFGLYTRIEHTIGFTFGHTHCVLQHKILVKLTKKSRYSKFATQNLPQLKNLCFFEKLTRQKNFFLTSPLLIVSQINFWSLILPIVFFFLFVDINSISFLIQFSSIARAVKYV